MKGLFSVLIWFIYGTLTGAEAWFDLPIKSIPLEQTATIHLHVRHTEEEWPDIDPIQDAFTQKNLIGDRSFTLQSARSQLIEEETFQHSIVTYTLEPWIIGSHTIILPPLRIFSPTGEQLQALWLEPLVVEITPASEEEAVSPTTQLLSLTDGPLLLSDPDASSAVAQQRSSYKEAERNMTTLSQRSFPWRFLLGGIVLSVFIWWLRKRIFDIKQMFGITTKEDNCPRLLALRALDYLKSRKCETEEEIDLFYIELTQIVRQFVEDEYGIHAPEHTTEEFLEEARHSSLFSMGTQELLSSFLHFGDMVKFADLDATPDQCDGALESAREFVES